MRLFFQTKSRSKRVAIDTDLQVWNDNYYYLGPWHTYVEVSTKDYIKIIQELDFNCWDYEEKF